MHIKCVYVPTYMNRPAMNITRVQIQRQYKSFFVLFILTIWVSKSYRIESKQTLKKQLPRATSRGRLSALNSQLGLVDRYKLFSFMI